MSWLKRLQRLRTLGVLGMNRRNSECILDLNPRRHFAGVDDKLRMRNLCRRIGVATPAIHAVIASYSTLGRLPQLLAACTDFVIKPNHGAGGRGILIVTSRDGESFLRPSGERLTLADIRGQVAGILAGLFSLAGRCDQALIQQRVVADAAFDPISYQGLADVRVVLYKRVPVMAMLRLPTSRSGGRANLHQGGIGAGVDLETGRTTRAVCHNHPIERHPDTGADLIGFQVPRWPDLLDIARRVSHAVELGYVGMDIVLDRDQGPLLLEANARPGLAIQMANGQGLVPRFAEVERRLRGDSQASTG